MRRYPTRRGPAGRDPFRRRRNTSRSAENPAARLVGLVNEDEGLLRSSTSSGPPVPNRHRRRYDDGRHLTVTNVADTGLDQHDEHVMLRDPEADATALVVRARETPL